MTALVFVDANVFVYARDGRDSRKQQLAHAWLERLWRERAGRTSIQALSEFYVTVTRKLSRPMDADVAWDDVRALFAWNPQPVDREVLECGADIGRRYRLSWWDGLIVAAASLQSCPLLLTEDLQDGAVIAGVTIRSPFTLSAHEAPASAPVPARSGRARRR